MGSPRTNHFPSVYFIGKTGPSSHSTYITERANPSLAEEFIQNAFEQKRPKKSVSDFFFQTLVCEKQLKKLEQESPASLLVYRLPNATMIMSRFHPLHCDRRLQEVGPYRLSPGHAFFGNGRILFFSPVHFLFFSSYFTFLSSSYWYEFGVFIIFSRSVPKTTQVLHKMCRSCRP